MARAMNYLAFTQAMGMRCPILCAAAGGPFTVELAVAVCEAGGMGGIGVTRWPDAVAEETVRAICHATRGPFAVGLILALLAPDSRSLRWCWKPARASSSSHGARRALRRWR